MTLFEAPRENDQPSYMNVNALFRRRELPRYAKMHWPAV